jgi:hypothetical protein
MTPTNRLQEEFENDQRKAFDMVYPRAALRIHTEREWAIAFDAWKIATRHAAFIAQLSPSGKGRQDQRDACAKAIVKGTI